MEFRVEWCTISTNRKDNFFSKGAWKVELTHRRRRERIVAGIGNTAIVGELFDHSGIPACHFAVCV